MEELQIAMATEVETPLETLDSLMSILNKCRLVSSNAIDPVAWVLSRMTLPIIPKPACCIFAGLYVLDTFDRLVGIYASYKRKDPKENLYGAFVLLLRSYRYVVAPLGTMDKNSGPVELIGCFSCNLQLVPACHPILLIFVTFGVFG